jgi:broad specificity phosphatase PhoE
MARVIIVRHCESESNRLGGLDGGANSPLSARGRAQADAVGDGFRSSGLCEVVLMSSPLSRAADTAAAIGQVLGIEAELDIRLSAGETWAGRAFDLDDPATLPVVGAMVMQALADGMAGGATTLVVVSHRYPIWALLTVLYGDHGTAIMDELNNLGNGDRLELVVEGGSAQGEPVHCPLRR